MHGGYEDQYSVSYLGSFINTEALRLSAMGVTLLASSSDDGDDGVTGYLTRGSPSSSCCGYNPQ